MVLWIVNYHLSFFGHYVHLVDYLSIPRSVKPMLPVMPSQPSMPVRRTFNMASVSVEPALSMAKPMQTRHQQHRLAMDLLVWCCALPIKFEEAFCLRGVQAGGHGFLGHETSLSVI